MSVNDRNGLEDQLAKEEPGRRYARIASKQKVLLLVIGITTLFTCYEFLKTAVIPTERTRSCWPVGLLTCI